MLEIGTQKPQGKPFAINLALRNPKTGEVTGYRYFEADSGDELFEVWTRYNGLPKKDKKEKQQEVNNDGK